MFNLNTSMKPEYGLNENLIHEAISMYGIQCRWLFSERINEDFVFRDFSHFKVEKDYKDVVLLPEDSSNWEGDNGFNTFGLFNQNIQNLYISKKSLLGLYPDFFTEVGNRSKVMNSLLVTPSSTILEVTNIEEHNINMNNMWAYADEASSFKLTVKIYSNNLSDEGVTEIKTNIKLQEDEIFEADQEIDTSDIDTFFGSLEVVKDTQDTEGDKISRSGGPFGSLG